MRQTKPRVSIIISVPASDGEGARIEDLLQRIPHRDLGHPEVLIVEYPNIARVHRVVIAEYPNVAELRGRAILEGVRHAAGDLVVVLDGSGVCDPREIVNLVAVMGSPDVDVAVGSRYLAHVDPASRPSLGDVGRVLLTYVVNLLLHCRLTDVLSRFVVFRKDLLRGTLISNAEVAQYLALVFAIRGNCKIVEVPVFFRAPPENSKSSALTNRLRVIRVLLGEIVRSGWSHHRSNPPQHTAEGAT